MILALDAVSACAFQAGISLCYAEPVMERLSPKAIKAGLLTQFLGQITVSLESTSSTNDVARQLADLGAAEGTLVIAEEQTVGRGRRGRSWLATRGTSLLMSLVLYPFLSPSQAPLLTMASALAVAYAVEETSHLAVRFKWPNDILLAEKKLGGILTEISITGDTVDYAIVGIGLNVNLDPGQIPEIQGTATSISAELGRDVSRLKLLRAILRFLETQYLALQRGQSPCQEWAARLTTLGQWVEVSTPWGQESGYATGVGCDGTLIVRRNDGTEAHITLGDVA
jgi:BirA family biotin operon repressor/biotin-[acetyl-CoA-carboxylase] ligase